VVDPYDWLGVPKGPRPPTHYQLLGLDPSATDPVLIRAAADRQTRRLLPHLTGPDALAAEQAWADLEEARDTLLDPARRAHYDATVPLTGPAPATATAAAPEPTVPDISAFEEPPPPAAPAPSPWWKALPEPAAAGPDPWWKQPLPAEPAPTPVSATDVHTTTVPLPAARIEPTARPAHDLVPEPRRRRQTSPALVGFLGLLVAGLIGGGIYYAFGRKHNPPAPKIEPGPNLTQGGPKPRAMDDLPSRDDEPVVPEAPLPQDFADQLRPRTFVGHAGAISGLAISRSGSRFATVGADRTLRLWSVTKDAFVVRHTFTAPAVGVVWADDDRQMLAADGFVVGVFNPRTTKPPRGFESPRGGVSALVATPDGNRVLTGLTDGYLRLWDTATGRPDEWPAAARGAVTAVDVSSDGTRALVAVQDGPVSVWHLASRSKADEWTPHPGGAVAGRFSPDGKLAATAGLDGAASVYDLSAKREACRLVGHAGPVTGIAWQGGGRQLVTVGADGTARLWNARTGQPIRWVQTLDGKGTCVAVDPGDRYVLAGTANGTVHLFPLPHVGGEAVAGNVAKPPADPLPIPDPDAVGTAIGVVRNELAKDYRYPRADDVSILADNLRRRAGAENVPPPLRYGLFQEARTLAAKAGDAVTAVRAVEDLAAWFDVDELAEKAAALTALPADADPVALTTAGLVAAERAETDARPEVVTQLVRRLPDPAGLPKELADRLTGLRRRYLSATHERQAVGRALDLLRNAPDDQGANQTVGLYLCLARQDWAAGLPNLVKGSDPRLIDAARLDLSNPTDPKAQHRLGELWFAFAADAGNHRAKRAYLGRARLWFERESKAKLDVADEIKARGRLDDIAKLDVPGKDPAALPLLTPVVVRRAYNTVNPGALAVEWKLDGGAAGMPDGVLLPAGEPVMRSTFGLAPGGRLTLSMRPDGRQVRLFLAGQEVAFAAAGKTFRVTIDRKDTAVTLTAIVDDGEPATRTIELPPASRGPTILAVRLAGMATREGGARLLAAVARGPASLPPPTPE
jgi:WD40 repeat protein